MAFEIIEGDDGQLEVDWLSHEPTIPVFRYTLQKMLRQHVSRLYKVRNVAYNVKMSDIPEQEWNLIFEYHKIMTDALSLAFNSLVDDEEDWFPVSSVEGVCTMKDVNSPSCGNRNHYDYLESEPDDLDYVSPTCDNWEWMLFEDYQPLENMTTSYQKVLFRRQSETGDVCMEIEEVVQICSSYRPQYHEFSANFPGRFVSEVKRVLFVGGGDSMLLHETLKYPSLKKVVGLELDQVITRKSFQYFDTQPHFDDDRVEWWFGDATKTLLLLPKDYWASFDLVLVDLSETAMALSVTEELDVFAALALLLKPEGIMVKNELYIEEMSDVFDYTVQIRYDSPKICSQIMVMGSNRVDFFHDLPVDHQIHNNLLLPLDQISNRYEFMHDYRKNDARLQGKCDSVTTADENKEQEISAGILHVIDFEDVQGEVKLEKTLYQVIQEAGLTPISSPTSDDTDATLVIVILQEGYVIARAWPDHKYSAIGINLWGSFHKGQVLQNHLLRAFDTSSISSFRVVVGGMYGLTTWREDQLLIGPQVVQNRNCEIPSTEDSPATGEISMIELFSEFVFDQLLNIVHDNDLVVGVLCSFENEHCAAKEALEKSSKVDHIVTFWTCPALRTLIEVDEDEEVSYEEFSNMFSCEKAMIQQLQEVVDVAKSLIDVFVVDSNAPFEMVQVFNSIWSLSKYRQYLEEERSLFLALSTVPDAPFQRHFLDRYRKDVRYDPTTRAEFILYDKGSKSSPLEIGAFFFHFG
jgi:spermidine synthase/S-adenosylmethionine/arginine decarboxylase-like enzyme